MDSNRRHINPKMFWTNHTCKKVGVGDTIEANQAADNMELHGVKHVILHVGTNDVETKKSAEQIANEIIQVAGKLRDRSNASTYVSSLPPRNDYLNNKGLQVNHYLKLRMPESVQFIDNMNMDVDDLVDGDRKHIKEQSVRKLVKNMKDAIRNNIQHQRELDDFAPQERDRPPRFQRTHKNAVNRDSGNHNINSRDGYQYHERKDRDRYGHHEYNNEGKYANKNNRQDPQRPKDGIMDILRDFVTKMSPMVCG